MRALTVSLLCLALSLAAQESEFPSLWLSAFPEAGFLAKEDALLTRVCQDRAKELASLGFLSHENGFGERVGDQMIAQGFESGEWGEVLGAGPDLISVFEAWLKSQTHFSVLSQRWVSFGLGQARFHDQIVVVARFWRP